MGRLVPLPPSAKVNIKRFSDSRLPKTIKVYFLYTELIVAFFRSRLCVPRGRPRVDIEDIRSESPQMARPLRGDVGSTTPEDVSRAIQPMA
jgi:hypothetical protein